MKVKPEMIQDSFMGDYYLGCPNCKEKIVFPLIRNPEHINDKSPTKCRICGAEFDWSKEKVNHPDHYNIPGRKECIEEMLELFGTEKVQAFCKLNTYKYKYRYLMKNGKEDLKKAKWYEDKNKELEDLDLRKQIAKHYGLQIQENQLIEEMAELTQAICKINRDGCNNISYFENLIEEIADVKLVLSQVIMLLKCEQEVQKIINQKIERTIERIGKKR